MSDEPKAMREIHEIRERLYEEQKDWTQEQLLEHLNAVGARRAQELGLRIIRSDSREPEKKTG